MSGSRAVTRARAGTAAWKDAARAQLGATARHEDFYALLGEAVESVYALDDVLRMLAEQVARYEWTVQRAGGRVYDDSRSERRPIEPAARLRQAWRELAAARARLAEADRAVNAAWSAIGHIGVDV